MDECIRGRGLRAQYVRGSGLREGSLWGRGFDEESLKEGRRFSGKGL